MTETAAPSARDARADDRPDSRVAIVGLGYVGLPLAIAFVEAGLEVEGIDANNGRVAELNAGRSPIDDVSDDRLRGRPRRRPQRRRPERPRTWPTPTSSSSASRRRSPARRTPISGRCCRPPRSSANTSAPVSSSSSSRRPSRGRRPGRSAQALERVGPPRRRRLRPRVRPGARQPGRSGERLEGRPAPRRRDDPGRRRTAPQPSSARSTTTSSSCPRPTPPSSRSSSRTSSGTSTSRSSTSSRCCASGWASTSGRSSTPRRPSRSGSCASRPGPGVGGHCIPVDPVLPRLAGTRVRLRRSLRRARRRHQPRDAAPRRRPRRRGAQRPGQGASRRPRRRARRRLQAERPRRPQLAGRGDHGAASATVAPRSPTTTRTCRRSATPMARPANRSPSTSCSPASDAVVVVTPHRAIDWAAVYERAELVVDTVNSSHGLDVRPRQVLRLGAGWSGG